MENRKVIANIPTRLPINTTVLYTLVLSCFQVSNVVWAVFITTFVFYWVICLVGVFTQEKVDIFSNEEKTSNTFQEKLKKKMEENGNK